MTHNRTIEAKRAAQANGTSTAPAPSTSTSTSASTSALVPAVVAAPARKGRPPGTKNQRTLPTQEIPTLADAIDYLQSKVDFTQGIINEFRQFATKFGK